MKKVLIAAIAACALAVAGPAAAALVIAPYDPTGACTVNTYSHGVLHLEKTCTTPTPAAAGADITGFTGQTFATASFTLASPTQCNGGSPRFDILDSNGKVFFLGCNNVTPVTNANGSVTYSFTMADLLRINPTLGTPGTIQAADIAVDVQGVADISNIVFNGVRQTVAGPGNHPKAENACKHGGWRNFSNPSFRNQGQCVSYAKRHKHDAEEAEKASKKHTERMHKDIKHEGDDH
jgi:hypothetical protein